MARDEVTRCGAVDVHYLRTRGARAALVVCPDTTYGEVVEEHTARAADVVAYRPGHFYERELPPLRTLLTEPEIAPLDLLVVDGYVTLDTAGRPGLGARIHAEAFAPVVIGVAKTPYLDAAHAIEVVRGETARRPLYVTAAGMPAEEAATLVAEMAGRARLPDALRRVDRLARAG